jgi:hypothetical protein
MCHKILLAFPLDDRIIRTDWDAGFVEGRQYGRGKTGGQVGVPVQGVTNRVADPYSFDTDPDPAF